MVAREVEGEAEGRQSKNSQQVTVYGRQVCRSQAMEMLGLRPPGIQHAAEATSRGATRRCGPSLDIERKEMYSRDLDDDGNYSRSSGTWEPRESCVRPEDLCQKVGIPVWGEIAL